MRTIFVSAAPRKLLPATCAPFEPRGETILVADKLASLTDEKWHWLTEILHRIGAIRILNPDDHLVWRQLTRQLRRDSFWDLCSVTLPQLPAAAQAYEIGSVVVPMVLNVQGHMTFLDMVWGHDMGFKLAEHTIRRLEDYYRTSFYSRLCPLATAAAERMAVFTVHEEFLQEVNGLQFRFEEDALEGLGETGTGELMEGRAERVAQQILQLFAPSEALALSLTRASQPPPSRQPREASQQTENDEEWFPVEDQRSLKSAQGRRTGPGPVTPVQAQPRQQVHDADRVFTPTPPGYPDLEWNTRRRELPPPNWEPSTIGLSWYRGGQPMVWENGPSPSSWWPTQRSQGPEEDGEGPARN